jgi:hypothetical protein
MVTAVEQFTVTLTNPGGEVTLRFMGKMLSNPSSSQEAVLREAIEECFEPKDSTTTDGLAEVFRSAENSYFQTAGQTHGPAELFYIDSGLFPGPESDREQYLLRMSGDQLKSYENEIQSASRRLEQLKTCVGRLDKWEHVRKSLDTVLSDIGTL